MDDQNGGGGGPGGGVSGVYRDIAVAGVAQDVEEDLGNYISKAETINK